MEWSTMTLTHQSSLVVWAPMPRLGYDHSISASFRKLSLAEVVKPAIHTADIDTSERALGEAGHALIPRLAHALARLNPNQCLEVKARVVGRGGMQQQTREDARSRSGLDDRRAGGFDSVMDERQR